MRAFAYAAAGDPRAAVRLVADAEPGTKFLAGGTTLFDLMKLGVESPPAVIDVAGLNGLDQMDTTGADELVIGAGARMAVVAEDPVLRTQYPALAESLAKAASQQLRSMATVGGNLLQRTRCMYFRGGAPFPCNKRDPGSGCAPQQPQGSDRENAVLGTSPACIATYAGDWAVALVAFDAVIDVLGPDGERSLSVAELHREPGDHPELEHTLAPDELILRIRIPTTPSGRASTYHKIRDRESYAFALASAAVALDLDEDGVVTDARIAVGGVATRPWRAGTAEALLLGRPLSKDRADEVGAAVFADAHAGRENGYKITLGARTVADAIMIAAARATR